MLHLNRGTQQFNNTHETLLHSHEYEEDMMLAGIDTTCLGCICKHTHIHFMILYNKNYLSPPTWPAVVNRG
jgi:hypothetical protein